MEVDQSGSSGSEQQPPLQPQVLATEPTLGISEADSSFRLETAARLVDLKGVARPPTFNGSAAAWPTWKFRMQSVAALLGLRQRMDQAMRMSDAQLEALTRSEMEEASFL